LGIKGDLVEEEEIKINKKGFLEIVINVLLLNK
jgi:hypothetical protein